MNQEAVKRSIADNDNTNIATNCSHCGLMVSSEINLVKGSEHEDVFCCKGCKIVYYALKLNGLADYYDFRKADYKPGSYQPEYISTDYSWLETEDFTKKYATRSGEELKLDLYIKGIHCSACIWVIERLSHIVDGLLSARLHYGTHTLTLHYLPEKVRLSEIAELLASFGYEVAPRNAERNNKNKDKSDLKRLGVAAICAANTMMIAVSLYQGMFTDIELKYRELFHWVSLFLTLPVILYSAQPFYRTALAGLLVKRPHVDLPLAIGIILSFLLSVYNTFSGSEYVYFDSVCVLVFFLLLGRYLQKNVHRKCEKETELFSAFFPLTAIRMLVEGEEIVLISSLEVGDRVRVGVGERVPVDGKVVLGESSVDQSILNGEPKPLAVTFGSDVYAGTLNVEAAIEVKITKSSQQSRATLLMDTLKNGTGKITVTYADKISFYFVFIVLILALATFFLWLPSGVNQSINATVALLVVSCPCAFALAAPLAFAVVVSNAARRGVFIKRPQSLLDLLQIKNIVFDKTGTLTYGKLEVSDLKLTENQYELAYLLSIVNELESIVPTHPIAQALLSYTEKNKRESKNILTDITYTSGVGVLGSEKSSGKRWSIVRPASKNDFGVVLKEDETIVLKLFFKDVMRKESREVLDTLRSFDLETYIASGDSQMTADEVGSALNFRTHNIKGSLLPEEKSILLKNMKGGSAFMGDGVNDAQALSASDISIGVRSTAQSSLENSDIYISKNIMQNLLVLWNTARKLDGVIKRNIIFSVFYNIIGVALAMAGMMTPLLAAILMPISSIAVVLSSLTLKDFK